MNVTFVKSVMEAENIVTFHWQPEQPVSYTAGQYIQLTLPHDNADDRGIKRWFTLSSSPTEPDLTITTKDYGDKASSFKKTLFALEPGAAVEMAEPEGDFILPDNPSLDLVFIAGGIGVTPYHSMIKYLSDKGEKRSIKLLYAAQADNQIAFNELFSSYGVDLVPYIDKRLTTDEIMAQIGSAEGKMIYLSGPEPMVEALTDSLKAAGLTDDNLKSDYFPGYDNDYSS